MTREEFNEFIFSKDIYSENSSTQSSDERVLELYSYILEYEKIDSDWWDEGHGTTDVLMILEKYDIENFWDEVKKDIINWNENQVGLFAQSLLDNSKDIANERIDLYNYLYEKEIHKNELEQAIYFCGIDFNYVNLHLLKKLALNLKLEEEIENINKFDDWFYIKRLYTAINSKTENERNPTIPFQSPNFDESRGQSDFN